MHHLETNGLNKQQGGINSNIPVFKKIHELQNVKVDTFIIIIMHKITTILLSKYKTWHKKTKLFQNCKELFQQRHFNERATF